MTHLHDRVTALVDGELSAGARCRALTHLERCAACRDAVDAERATRRLTAGAPTAEPSAELVARLRALGGPSGPLRPREGHLPGTPRVPPLPSPGHASGPLWTAEPRPRARSTRPAGRPAPWSRGGAAPAPRRGRRRRRGVSLALIGTMSLVSAGVLGASLAGGAIRLPEDARAVFAPLVVERGGVVGDRPVVTPAVRSADPEAATDAVGAP